MSQNPAELNEHPLKLNRALKWGRFAIEFTRALKYTTYTVGRLRQYLAK